jgi:hypothetical protein
VRVVVSSSRIILARVGNFSGGFAGVLDAGVLGLIGIRLWRRRRTASILSAFEQELRTDSL